MSTTKKSRIPRWHADNNKFVTRSKFNAHNREFARQITTVRLLLWGIATGDDATELLARMAIVIGTPCEAGARQFGAVQWVRRLHGALHTIQSLCLTSGYRWDEQYAPALDVAIELAIEPRPEISPDHSIAAWTEASALYRQIMDHTVAPDSIADTIK